MDHPTDHRSSSCLPTYLPDPSFRMDRYQRVEKPRAQTPINKNEIRITSQGRMRNYITYAMILLLICYYSVATTNIKVINTSTSMTWIYVPSCYGIPIAGNEMVWLSHWNLGNQFKECRYWKVFLDYQRTKNVQTAKP